MQGIPIGQLLVEQGVLTARQVEHILKVQKACSRPFGDLAERLYGIDPKAVEDAWVEQYLRTTGMIDLERQPVDPRCLALIGRRQAWQFHLLPLQREEREIQMATSKHSLVRAVNFVTRALDEPVYFVLADRNQLDRFLMMHYPVPAYVAEAAAALST